VFLGLTKNTEKHFYHLGYRGWPKNTQKHLFLGDQNHYKLASPRTEKNLASICHAITAPPVTKIRLQASFGVYRSQL